MKPETEKTQFVKEAKEKTKQYIFQKNKITKIGVIILIVILVTLGLIISSMYFND